MTDAEFVAGYLDGRDANAPEPGRNRSHRYRHSFAVGRAEIAGKPLSYEVSLSKAAKAEAKDKGF